MSQRVTFKETEGCHRAYSYDYLPEDYDGQLLPAGKFFFDDHDAPNEIIGESESLSQSDECPIFLWNPDGEIIIIVEENN